MNEPRFVPFTRVFLSLVLLLPLTCGCFTVRLTAPPGKEVYLLPAEAETQTERRWEEWYLLYGWTPLTARMPVSYIARDDYDEVRVTVEDNLKGAFYGLIYTVLIPIGVVNQTVLIEGNHSPAVIEVTPPAPKEPAPAEQ